MNRTDPQLGIRLPGDLKERVRQSAAAHRRSMNGEIVTLIEFALEAQKEKGSAEGATSPSHDHEIQPSQE